LNPTKLGKRILYSRIELLENNIIELEKMRVQSEHEPDLFQKKTNEWSLRYGLLESIQIVIDISCHIVGKYNLGNPNSYGNCVELLLKFNYIEESLGKNIRSMIKLRNLLAHEYALIDVNKLTSYLSLLGDFRNFIRSVSDYVKE
jgi:uncharacterized protein YutE (UPF0331/DUF86 family)